MNKYNKDIDQGLPNFKDNRTPTEYLLFYGTLYPMTSNN